MKQSQALSISLIFAGAMFFVPLESLERDSVLKLCLVFAAPTTVATFLIGLRKEVLAPVEIIKAGAFIAFFIFAIPWEAKFNLDWVTKYPSWEAVCGLMGSGIGVILIYSACGRDRQLTPGMRKLINISLCLLVAALPYFILYGAALEKFIHVCYGIAITALAFANLNVTFRQTGLKAGVDTFGNTLLLVFASGYSMVSLAQ